MVNFKIKDWSSFQSYKDRSPPWIRLHKSLLDNFKFQKMSVGARALLPMLWLMASEDKDPVSGMIRFGYEEISFRLRQDIKEIKLAIDEIVKNSFIEVITVSYINDTESVRNGHSETETETETETESSPSAKNRFEEFWHVFPKQRKGSRAKAQGAYRRALTRDTEENIHAGLAAYIASAEVKTGYAKGAEAWLNDDRWTTDYSIRPVKGGPPEPKKPEFTLDDIDRARGLIP